MKAYTFMICFLLIFIIIPKLLFGAGEPDRLLGNTLLGATSRVYKAAREAEENINKEGWKKYAVPLFPSEQGDHLDMSV
jgi:hypothetical protein